MNYILTIVFLCLTMAYCSGYETIVFSGHIIHLVEYEGNNTHSQKIDTDESACEDDFPLACSKEIIQVSNTGFKSLVLPLCFFPSKLYYSIWLPPDIC